MRVSLKDALRGGLGGHGGSKPSTFQLGSGAPPAPQPKCSALRQNDPEPQNTSLGLRGATDLGPFGGGSQSCTRRKHRQNTACKQDRRYNEAFNGHETQMTRGTDGGLNP
ncbi:unnamed protein product [Merluccius merluccius]